MIWRLAFEIPVALFVFIVEVNVMGIEHAANVQAARDAAIAQGWSALWTMHAFVTPASLLGFGLLAGCLDNGIFKLFTSGKRAGSLARKIARVVLAVTISVGIIGGLFSFEPDTPHAALNWWTTVHTMPIGVLLILRYVCASLDELFAYAAYKARDEEVVEVSRRNPAGNAGNGTGSSTS